MYTEPQAAFTTIEPISMSKDAGNEITMPPGLLEVVPNELWIALLAYMQPPDILVLGQVCARLHQLISRRETWIAVLRSVCYEHALFFPSYPVDTMGLAHLQSVALGPSRWNRMVEKHAAVHVPGTSSSSWTEPTKMEQVSTTNLRAYFSRPDTVYTYLVPGGRFLIAIGNVSIKLWDLGVVGQSSPLTAPRMISSTDPHPMTSSYTSAFAVTPIAEDRLRIAAVRADRTTQVNWVQVYDVSPGNQDPSFQDMGCLRIPEFSLGWKVSIDGDHLLLYYLNFVIVWQVSREEAQRSPYRYFSPEVTTLAILSNERLIHVSVKCLHVWDVHSLGGLAALGGNQHDDGLAIQISPPLPFHAAGYSRNIASWIHSSGLPITFDLLEGNQRSFIHRYTLDMTQGAVESPSLRAIVALPRGYDYRIPGFHMTSAIDYGASTTATMIFAQCRRLWNGTPRSMHTWIYSIDPQETTVTYNRRRALSRVKIATLFRDAESVESVCSASGRVVYRTKYGELTIAEYFKYPDSSVGQK